MVAGEEGQRLDAGGVDRELSEDRLEIVTSNKGTIGMPFKVHKG